MNNSAYWLEYEEEEEEKNAIQKEKSTSKLQSKRSQTKKPHLLHSYSFYIKYITSNLLSFVSKCCRCGCCCCCINLFSTLLCGVSTWMCVWMFLCESSLRADIENVASAYRWFEKHHHQIIIIFLFLLFVWIVFHSSYVFYLGLLAFYQ